MRPSRTRERVSERKKRPLPGPRHARLTHACFEFESLGRQLATRDPQRTTLSFLALFRPQRHRTRTPLPPPVDGSTHRPAVSFLHLGRPLVSGLGQSLPCFGVPWIACRLSSPPSHYRRQLRAGPQAGSSTKPIVSRPAALTRTPSDLLHPFSYSPYPSLGHIDRCSTLTSQRTRPDSQSRLSAPLDSHPTPSLVLHPDFALSPVPPARLSDVSRHQRHPAVHYRDATPLAGLFPALSVPRAGYPTVVYPTALLTLPAACWSWAPINGTQLGAICFADSPRDVETGKQNWYGRSLPLPLKRPI